jgi:plasmid maintenance system antidote protein VapI
MTPQFWLGLQMDYDLDVAEDNFDTDIKNIKSARGFLKEIDTNVVRENDERYE